MIEGNLTGLSYLLERVKQGLKRKKVNRIA
jgi:hypothetical protein